MVILDEDYAKRYLTFVGYYRLSGYTLLLETPGIYSKSNGKTMYQRTHKFRKGVSFSDLISLYDLDRRLRLHVLDAIERIEVGVRSLINNIMTERHADPHWYLQNSKFNKRYRHSGLLELVKRETYKNKPNKRNTFCNHYYEVYSSPSLPPGWMVAEQLSLGVWSKMYAEIASRQDKKAVSDMLDCSFVELTSWLHALTYLRNLAAHHARLVGINYVILPKVSSKFPNDIDEKTFVPFAAVLHHLLRRISPRTQWSMRLKALLDEFSEHGSEGLLGFDKYWFDDKFWR